MEPNSLTDAELATSIEISVQEYAKRDYKATRILLTRLVVELIDSRLEVMGGAGFKLTKSGQPPKNQ